MYLTILLERHRTDPPENSLSLCYVNFLTNLSKKKYALMWNALKNKIRYFRLQCETQSDSDFSLSAILSGSVECSLNAEVPVPTDTHIVG